MLSNRWSLCLIFHVFIFDLYSASSLLNLPFTTHTKNEDGSHSSVLKVPFGLGTIGLQVNYDKKADDSANQNNIQPSSTIKNLDDCKPSTESAAQEPLSNNGNSESSGFLLLPQIPNGFNFKVHLGHAGLAPPHQRTYNCHQHHYPGSEPYPRPTYDYYPQQPYSPFYYPPPPPQQPQYPPPPPQQPQYPTQEPKPQYPPTYYPTQEPKPQYPPTYYPTQEPKPQYPPTYYPTQEPNSQPPTYYPTPESKPPQSYYPTQEPKPQQPPTYYPGQEYYPSQEPNPQQPSYNPGQETKPQAQPTYPTYPTNPTNPTYPQKLDPWQTNSNESPSPSVPGDSQSSPDVTETPETPSSSESPEPIPAISIDSTPGSTVDSGSGTAGNQIPSGNENENTDTDSQPWGPSKNEGNDANDSDNKGQKEESGEGSLDIRLGNNSPGRKPSRNRVHQ